MTGTLAGALEARHIPAYNDSLEAEVEGDIEEGDDKVLLLTKVQCIGISNGILAPILPERNPANTSVASSLPSLAATPRSRCRRLPQHGAAAGQSGS
jgi:hypothetical protein